MTRRNPREGLRDQWVPAILASDIGNACRVLLMLFAYRMSSEGKVAIPRTELAELLHVHPQRIAERIAEARQAGLLDIVGGTGVRGRNAQYVAVIPTHCVPLSGTQPEGMRTGERYAEIGTHSGGSETDCVPLSGTHNTRAYLSERQTPEITADYSRTSSAPKERSEERAAGDPAAAALFPSSTRNRTSTTGRPAAEPKDDAPKSGNPLCQICGKDNLYAPLTIRRGICASCVLIVDSKGMPA